MNPTSVAAEAPVEPDSAIGALSRLLDTERSASKALLVAMRELESRLAAECARAQQLQARFESEHASSTFQLNQNAQLWGEVETLKLELALAKQRSLWQRLMGR